MFDSLAFFDMNPLHLGLVLLLMLLLFGPQKLPDIGKQIGKALRELKNAGNEVMSSFSTDHEPEPYRPEPYRYDNSNSYGYSTQYDYSVPHTPAVEAPPDLTDYTIVGLPVGGVQQTESPLDGYQSGPANGSDGSVSQVEASQVPAAAAPAGKEVTDHV